MHLGVEHFTMASQALERFQQPSKFDVVIDDVVLEGDMDGVELVNCEL